MENKVLIAERIKGRGDTWSLKFNGQSFDSLTEVLEVYYQLTQQKCDYVLSPLKGELYALIGDNKQPPTKKFSIYDEQ